MTSFLSRLFGKSTAAAPPAAAEPHLHNDFRIFPDPINEGGVYRIAARIEKTFGDEIKTHRLIRADTRATLDEATEASIGKAKQAIDQLGDTLFG
ncbi:MAG: HlyU family transcriptional regulator, partial [Paracoccaceae bacterium]